MPTLVFQDKQQLNHINCVYVSSLRSFEGKKTPRFSFVFRKQKSFVFIFCVGPVFKTTMYAEGKTFHDAVINVVCSSYTLNVI